jgi:apolipoprotein N-acyltransferase
VFIQPASLAGVHGLTLATIILAGMPMFRARGFAALAAALVLWAGFGQWRLDHPVPDTGIKLALVQPDFPVPGTFDRPTLMAHWQRLLAMSQAGIAQGAGAIIWPEAASPWQLDSDANARQALAAVTGTTPVLAGAFHVLSDTDARNSLVVTAGPGPALAVYDKWKLVPFGEYTPKWIPVKIIPDQLGTGFTAGSGPVTLHLPSLPPVAPEICYEDVFTGQIIDRRNRPAWMLVITDDSWFGDSTGTVQHFENARLRAVEEGLPLARDANAGISAMFDAYGHETASLPLNAQGDLLATLPGSLPPTVYARLGLEGPGMLSLLAIITGILISISI